MKILIDIGHPAHVHYFKNFAGHFISKGHQILFTCRNKEVVIDLLERNKFNYICLGNPYKTICGKILGLLIFDFKILKISLSHKPDIYLSSGSIYAAHIAFLLHRPHITLEDTFNMEQVRLYLPFSSVVLTGRYQHINLGNKEISYNGYQELAYLHPAYFFPDSSIRTELSVGINEKYFIMRFVSWEASHDVGQEGLTIQQKQELTGLLAHYGKVFISSEKKMPSELERYKFPLSPDRMHQALAHANLFLGEGATMASECAMLGTPAIYINPIESSYIDELERQDLLCHFRKYNGIVDKVKELLNDNLLRQKSVEKSKNILSKKINVTAFLIWFIENWPASFEIMKENPGYQEKFRGEVSDER
jgi:uncharacterized protein